MIGGQEVYQEVCIATCRHRPQVFDESWTEFIYFWYTKSTHEFMIMSRALTKMLRVRPPGRRLCLRATSRLLCSGHYKPPPSVRRIGELNEEVRGFHLSGNYAAALTASQEAYELARGEFGTTHPAFASAANNLALFHKELGNVDQATQFYQEALASYKGSVGDKHKSTAAAAYNLAVLLRSQGLCAEAEPLDRAALEARVAVLGDDHPDTLSSLSSLGATLFLRGELAEAEPLLRRALEARERLLGTSHPRVFSTARNLAACLQALERHEEATSLLRYYPDPLLSGSL